MDLHKLPKDILIKLLTTDLNNKYLKEAAKKYFEKCKIADKVEETQQYDDRLDEVVFGDEKTLRKQNLFHYLMSQIEYKSLDTIDGNRNHFDAKYYHHIFLDERCYPLKYLLYKDEIISLKDEEIVYGKFNNYYLVVPEKEKYLWDYVVSLDFKIFIDRHVCLDFSHWK